MRRSPAVTVGLFIALALATAWCFSVLLGRRFAGGEVYPPCSTQRADPMGAKALYEAVDRLDGTTCERNFKRLAKLSEVSVSADAPAAASRQGQTLVLLDVRPWAFRDGENIDGDTVRDFAAAGGRVVITVSEIMSSTDRVSQASNERQEELKDARREGRKDRGKKKTEADEMEEADADDVKRNKKEERNKRDKDEDSSELPFKPARSVADAIQLDIKRDSLDPVPKDGHVLDTPQGISALGGPLPRWLSRASLDLAPVNRDGTDQVAGTGAKPGEDNAEKQDEKAGPAAREPWQVLAVVEDKPVLAERRFGRGSIVVATDSYFATNQALSFNPAPEFLAWLLGDARHVIFDETHLGTQEKPGIMTLARRYRLQGFFLGGVLLFALFVWQSSSSLVPAQDGMEPGARMVTGQGAVAGLISLLRRGVSRSRLLQACFDQWVRNHPHPSPALQARIEQARALLPSTAERPSRGTLVGLYQRLCETLHPKRH